MVSQVRTLTPNFTVVTLKMWAYNSPNRQNWYFFVKICPKRYTPLSDFFYKIWLGERESQVRTLTPNFIIVG